MSKCSVFRIWKSSFLYWTLLRPKYCADAGIGSPASRLAAATAIVHLRAHIAPSAGARHAPCDDRSMSSASMPDTDAATITRDELIRSLRRRRIVLVDVLTPESFAAIHIPGAINLPVADISRLPPSLAPARYADHICYCR